MKTDARPADPQLPLEAIPNVQTQAKPTAFWSWGAIATLDDARRIAREGAWAAVLVGVMTALITTMVLLMSDSGLPDAVKVDGIPQPTAWTFIDVGIYLAIARYIYKLSRVAAVIGLVLYVCDRIYLWTNANPASAGWLVSLLIIAAFINGVRGTFAYHRLRKQSLNNPV